MDPNSQPAETPTTCPDCPEDGICASCIEVLREKGIPETTLKWLELPQDERIRTVMF